jgi:hypothetical protein
MNKKQLIIDNNTNEKLSSILKNNDNNKVSTGLIIGTINGNKDYILQIIATPPIESTISTSGSTNESESNNWIVNHALQV